jgi:lipoprotein-anchoring transpeptidase ErfK/SrfK
VFSAEGTLEKRYDISTAKRGVGETQNSYQTPRGWHRICEKIGDGAASDTIIFRREVTPWKYTPELHAEYPNKDWILTRILWLCGQEPGLNQGSRDGVLVDSYARYIYIHGAGRHVPMGTPTSLGCVRMTSEAVIELFERTPVGMEVLIDENG